MAKEATVTPEIYRAEQSKMNRAIPGQSLTNDPANPAPYEQAPKFTNVHEANEYFWDYMTDEEIYPKLMNALNNGVPVMKIVQVVLFNEFQKGLVNPDLMLMLAEPLAYMLIALAERLDIDIEIDGEGDEEEGVFGVQMEETKLAELQAKASGGGFAGNGVVTDAMAAEMDALPKIDSLLSAPTEEEAPAEPEAPQQPSLMAPPEGQ
jgi:hypothetical protein